MKKILIALTVCLLTCTSAAFAQSCTKPNLVDLSACVESGRDQCLASYSTCDELKVALTIDDVEEIARAKCCSISSKFKRKACLVKEGTKYKPVLATGTQKAFFTAARKRVKSLSPNCATITSYDKLF